MQILLLERKSCIVSTTSEVKRKENVFLNKFIYDTHSLGIQKL